MLEQETNLAQMFRNRTAMYGDRPRWRQKRHGVQYAATWRENQRMTNRVLVGLDALGVRPGDPVAIMSETRWEWVVADWGALGLGAVVVPIYPSNLPATVEYILHDSGATLVFAENRAQYEKLLTLRARIPEVRRVILFDDAELVAEAVTDDPAQPWALSFDALRTLSSRSDEEADQLAAERAAAIREADLFTIVYTSGTTGMPKGVMHTHGTMMAQLRGNRAALDTGREGDKDLLFLPLSHIYGREEHLASHERGLETTIAESIDTVAVELNEAQPDMLFSVPRVYEKAYAKIQAKAAEGSHTKQRIFAWATAVGREMSRARQARRPISPGLRLRYAAADRLVFKKIRAALGGRLRFAVSSAAPLEMNILEFLDGAGINIMEAWGMTETSGGFTMNQDGRQRLGTVGRPYVGHEAKIADDGELLVRGPCIMIGYHNNPEATAEVLDRDGWLHTGDIANIDTDGFVRIVDRKKDLIITAAGKNIAPQQVENTIKAASPLISQVVVYGDRKPYLVGLVTLEPTAVHAWAEEHGIDATADLRDLADDPRLRVEVDAGIAQANSQLASYETIKYYDILPEDFTVENNLLTPTLKVRRRAIYQRYGDRFEALYRPTKHETASTEPVAGTTTSATQTAPIAQAGGQ